MKNINSYLAGILSLVIILPCLANISIYPAARNDTPRYDASFNNGGIISQSMSNDSAVAATNMTPVATTKSTSAPAVTILYRVQILALKHPINNTESLKVNGMQDKVYASKGSNFTRYYMGEFHDLQSATEYKEQLIKDGFEDACIVAYKNGERVTIKESLAVLRENK